MDTVFIGGSTQLVLGTCPLMKLLGRQEDGSAAGKVTDNDMMSPKVALDAVLSSSWGNEDERVVS